MYAGTPILCDRYGRLQGHPDFAVFPFFPIRFGTLGAASFGTALPHSLGPLTIDAERFLDPSQTSPVFRNPFRALS